MNVLFSNTCDAAKPTRESLEPKSGIVYVLPEEGVGNERVVVVPEPSTNWLLVLVKLMLGKVVVLVEVRVVKEPDAGLIAPITVPSIAPPFISTVVAVKVPESVNSESEIPESRIFSSIDDIVAPEVVMSLAPIAKAVLISASEASKATPIAPEDDPIICTPVVTVESSALSKTSKDSVVPPVAALFCKTKSL